jgi:HlyD family secretion protein
MSDFIRLLQFLGLSLLTIVGLVACEPQPPKNTLEKHYRAHMILIHNKLHFTGTVQPLNESTLTSPVEAVVESMCYHYGQFVKKGAIIFALNSSELERQYNDTLTEYLKAKDSFTIARSKFVGTEDLWHAGLLSKNNYVSEKSGFNTARVSLMQATRKLSELLEKMGKTTDENLSNLSFAEFDKVRSALTGKHNLIYIKSPSDGVLLYPPKAVDENGGRTNVGSSIKAGQVLALIGNLRGIRVEIDIPEVDIDEIKAGLPATVRGIAFGHHELKGALVTINTQASSNNNSALPTFSAVVEVQPLNAEQQTWIKVGMSAAIELSVNSSEKLLIPIAAIQQKNGQNFVKIQAKNGSYVTHSVITGAVYGDKVAIDSGVRVGDELIY